MTIWTDSQNAYSSLHVFAQQWANRGMTTSTGKPLTHAQLLKELLKAVQLPQRVAVCKCAALTTKTDRVSKGNAFADEMTKKAAQMIDSLLSDTPADTEVLKQHQNDAHKLEKQSWISKGAKLVDDVYV